MKSKKILAKNEKCLRITLPNTACLPIADIPV